MDLSQIDNLIDRLEKKKTMRPGSPPTVIDGHMGVWRTLRHNRVFIELDRAGNLGRVLIGPPSFVGHKLNEIPSEVWQNLTPRATLKEFRNISVADNGIKTLKDSIKNAVGPEDTRRTAVDSLNTPEQLVPIARSAGFSDDEIKSSLAGNSPNEPLKEVSSRRSILREVPKPKTPSKGSKKEDAVSSIIEGALARLPQEVKGASGDDGDRKAAEFLDRIIADKLEENSEEALTTKHVRNIANGLRAGKFTQNDVFDELRELTISRNNLREKKFTKEQEDAASDGAKVKELLDNFDKEIEDRINSKIDEASSKFKSKKEVSDSRVRELAEETKQRTNQLQDKAEQQRRDAVRMREEAAAERQRAQEFMSNAQKARYEVESALDLLFDLAKELKSPQAKKEIEDVIESIRKSPFNRRSILLRLYQLLQLLLLFIPVL